MGLRIQNNIAAMNAHRNLTASDANMSKSLERLSSGYRINRASDDAAGLSISQGFRADIASFKVASRNTTEANALLQVAEGGMEQIGNMLTRLKELATQAASANVGSTERTKINSEATQLTTEIDRIANSTKYGSSTLLTGAFGASKLGTLAAVAPVTDTNLSTNVTGIVDDSADNIQYSLINTSGAAFASSAKVTALGAGVAEGAYTISQTAAGVFIIANTAGTVRETITTAGIGAGTTLTFANLGITFTVTGATIATAFSSSGIATAFCTGVTLVINRTGLTSLSVNNASTGTYTISNSGSSITITNSSGNVVQSKDRTDASSVINFDVLKVSFAVGSAFSSAELNGMSFTVSANTSAAGNVFQVGAKNDTYNQVSISITGVRTTDMSLTGLDLSTASGAQTALDTIDTAISTLAGARGDIGANMNRLSYAAANLQSSIENVQAAESVIRDVDMASEMTTFTKNQILMQASVSMLAQANQSPQLMLSLFK